MAVNWKSEAKYFAKISFEELYVRIGLHLLRGQPWPWDVIKKNKKVISTVKHLINITAADSTVGNWLKGILLDTKPRIRFYESNCRNFAAGAAYLPIEVTIEHLLANNRVQMEMKMEVDKNKMVSKVVRLNCGIDIPVLGFGTFTLANDVEETKQAVQVALQMGYRHFDTAKIYGSEPAVGRALTDYISSVNAIVDRSDIFLTSKLWGTDHHDPVSALRKTLENVGMEYLDLYLVHWPVKLKPGGCSYLPMEQDFEALEMETTWEGMQRCLEMGLCRSIGVSNFSSLKVQQLLDFASVRPAVNQVEMHPMWRQGKLRKFCNNNNIHVSAYSPLGGPGNSWGSNAVVDHPIIRSIALKHKASPAQVSLKWGMSMGASTIVKSFNQERMKENMRAVEVELDEQDLNQMARMEEVKIMRGEFLVNQTTSPYKSIKDLWDDEI